MSVDRSTILFADASCLIAAAGSPNGGSGLLLSLGLCGLLRIAWETFYRSFDLAQEPFRFGWTVEFDPYDVSSTPKKRTALGRMKHEATTLCSTRSTTRSTRR